MVGREPELAAVRSFVTRLAAPGAVLLEGDAGIGKTTVWEAGVAAAHAAGHCVWRCRAVAAEAQLPFAAVADLLADDLDEALPALPPPQRRALRTALLLEEPSESPLSDRVIAAAALGVVRHACSRAPLLIAIDDVQWLDEPSRTVLEFALRRLRTERVGLLLTRRGAGEEPPLAIGRSLTPVGIQTVSLRPLSLGALHRVIRARVGTALPRPVLRRLYAACGGNPFYALEIARALTGDPAALQMGDALPMPRTLSQLVHERIAALPAENRRLLEIVAALYDRRLTTVFELAHEENLDGSIDEAVAAGVLVAREGRLGFAHPLLASGVYSGMGPERRRAVHRLLADRDVRNEAGTVHRALAAESPAPEVAAELDRSASLARARGAAASAGRYAERAAELTPREQPDDSARRLIAAADHYVVAGDPSSAVALLSGLVERLGPGNVRAEALSLLGWISPGGDLALGARLVQEALAEVSDDPRLASIASLRLGLIEWIRGNLDGSVAHRAAAAELAREAGDPGLVAQTLSAVGYATGLRDCLVVDASREAVEIERSLPQFLGQYSPSIELGQLLMYDGSTDEARATLAGALEQATAAGDEAAQCNCLYRLAVLERRAGNWRRAREFSDETRELNAQAGSEQEYASCLAVGALLDAGTGRVREAREAAQSGLAAAERMDDQAFVAHHRGALGFLELSLGDAGVAQAWLAPGTQWLMGQGLGEVSMYPAFQHEVDAAVEAGDLRRAESLVTYLERLVARTGRSWTEAIALRGRGLLLAADGDLQSARGCLEQAVLAHEPVLEPLELGRTLLTLGKLERRAKRKRAARQALGHAISIFEALPAPLWQANAEKELARLGVRSAPGELTVTEARIAELAGGGMSNPEIAAAIFVSRKTVEANLSKVYRKLGVRSRVELARRLPPPEQMFPLPGGGSELP